MKGYLEKKSREKARYQNRAGRRLFLFVLLLALAQVVVLSLCLGSSSFAEKNKIKFSYLETAGQSSVYVIRPPSSFSLAVEALLLPIAF